MRRPGLRRRKFPRVAAASGWSLAAGLVLAGTATALPAAASSQPTAAASSQPPAAAASQSSVTDGQAAAVPAKMMIVGDSISEGLEDDFTWRYRLQQHLSQSGCPAVDFVGGYSGTNRLP